MSVESLKKVISDYIVDGGNVDNAEEAFQYINEGFDVNKKLDNGNENPFSEVLKDAVVMRAKRENGVAVDVKTLRAERKKDEELMKLPTFEDYVDNGLRTRPEYHVISTNILYYGCLMNLNFNAECIRKITKESSGLFKSSDTEFETAQKEWWYFYKKIILLRSFMLHNWDIPAPQWGDLLPERFYCGTLLSQEDFKEYMVKGGPGINVLKPDVMKE